MTDVAEPAPSASGSRVVTAAVVYFALVLAVGLVFGPARVFWLEPWLGPALAVLCEAPFLIAAMMFSARFASLLAGLGGRWPARLSMGVLALIMQQVADLSIGFGLRGVTLQQQLDYFQTLPGYIYVGMLTLFAAVPLLARGGSTDPPTTETARNTEP